ncbi:hypothetical protein FJY93_05305 [Candidatus Kaiserbacteria bacterium]|nr:hypothetical protein [Candidatus Kaiserbacteria bacterium]
MKFRIFVTLVAAALSYATLFIVMVGPRIYDRVERAWLRVENENLNQALQREAFWAVSGRVYRESLNACVEPAYVEAIQSVFMRTIVLERAVMLSQKIANELVKEKKCVTLPTATYKVIEITPTKLIWKVDRREGVDDNFDNEKSSRPRVLGIARIQVKGYPDLYRGVILPLIDS